MVGECLFLLTLERLIFKNLPQEEKTKLSEQLATFLAAQADDELMHFADSASSFNRSGSIVSSDGRRLARSKAVSVKKIYVMYINPHICLSTSSSRARAHVQQSPKSRRRCISRLT